MLLNNTSTKGIDFIIALALVEIVSNCFTAVNTVN